MYYGLLSSSKQNGKKRIVTVHKIKFNITGHQRILTFDTVVNNIRIYNFRSGFPGEEVANWNLLFILARKPHEIEKKFGHWTVFLTIWAGE